MRLSRRARHVPLAAVTLAAFYGMSLAALAQATPQTPTAPAPAVSTPPATAPANGTTSPPPDLAYGAYQRGYFVTALKEALKRLSANPKDAPAMTLLGELYTDGLAVPQDLTKAAHWYQLAADLGNREAIFALGVAYLQGHGVPADKAKAKALFERAAAAGHSGAQYNLGMMALEGDAKDFVTAAKDFRASAQGGNMDAAFSLALLYRAGKGVEKGPELAAQWLKLAADQRNVDAEVEYGIALFNGDGVTVDEKAAATYLLRAANQNNPIAENRIARMLAAGRGVPVDLIEAMKWDVLARAAGIKDAYLDGFLNNLTPAQAKQVQADVAKYVGNDGG